MQPSGAASSRPEHALTCEQLRDTALNDADDLDDPLRPRHSLRVAGVVVVVVGWCGAARVFKAVHFNLWKTWSTASDLI